MLDISQCDRSAVFRTRSITPASAPSPTSTEGDFVMLAYFKNSRCSWIMVMYNIMCINIKCTAAVFCMDECVGSRRGGAGE